MNPPLSMNVFNSLGRTDDETTGVPTPWICPQDGSARVSYYVRSKGWAPVNTVTDFTSLPSVGNMPDGIYDSDTYLTFSGDPWTWAPVTNAEFSTMPDSYEAQVALSVLYEKNDGSREVKKVTGKITTTSKGVFLIADFPDLKQGEKLTFICTSDKDDVFTYIEDSVPAVYFDVNRTMTAGGTCVQYHSYSDAITVSPKATIYRSSTLNAFAGGYRGWYYGRWNGQKAFDASLIDYPEPTDYGISGTSSEDQLEAFASGDGSNAINNSSLYGAMTEDDGPYTFIDTSGNSSVLFTGRWYGNDADTWIRGGKYERHTGRDETSSLHKRVGFTTRSNNRCHRHRFQFCA